MNGKLKEFLTDCLGFMVLFGFPTLAFSIVLYNDGIWDAMAENPSFRVFGAFMGASIFVGLLSVLKMVLDVHDRYVKRKVEK